jgi:acyl-CoA synthetase (AMP-forming)/AMP-acid ligase II
VATFNLADLFEGVVDAVPDREALVVGRDGGVVERLTYAELDRRVNRTAALLAETGAGIGPGDHVGLHLRNGAAYVEAMLAAFKLRAVPVNVNHRYVTAELDELAGDLDIGLVLTEPDLAERVRPLTDAGRLAALVVDGSWDDRLTAQPAERPVVADRSGDDLYILCTGGTTGRPKGVMWRHEDLFFASLGGRGVPRRGIPALDDPNEIGVRARLGMAPARRLPLCPLVHGAAQWILLQALLSGGTAILATDLHFDARAALSLVAESQAELIMLVGDATAGPLADALAAEPGRWDLRSLQMISSSGAILAPAVQRRLGEQLPGVKVLDMFGASETGGQGRLAPGRARQGQPRLMADPHNAVFDDDGRRVAPGSGTIGRLARRGHIPLGYYRDEAKTAATFLTLDGERWSVPGDLARVEDDGAIVVLGRGSVCINTGGEKVHPEEVEAVVKAHPGVADAVVVGVPDERFGSRVAAVVAWRPGAAPPGEDGGAAVLDAHVRQLLSGYKVPRSWTFVERCQRLVSGKPDYRWAGAVASGGNS